MNPGPDWQSAFNWVGLGLIGVVTWLLKGFHGELKDARKDHAELVKALPETYARRDDMKDSLQEVRDALKRIEDKLDRKVDL